MSWLNVTAVTEMKPVYRPLVENNILYNHQNGLWKKYSTELAVLQPVDDIFLIDDKML